LDPVLATNSWRKLSRAGLPSQIPTTLPVNSSAEAGMTLAFEQERDSPQNG